MRFQTALIAALVAVANAAPLPAGQSFPGSGIQLTNAGAAEQEFCFFENIDNGDGWAVPNFTTPSQCVTLPAGAAKFVALPASYKGRVTRTRFPVGVTYGEFQLAASNDNAAHGDISIEQGCDGAAQVNSTDGSGAWGGFTKDIVSGAPAAALMTRPEDGAKVIASTMGNWLGAANTAASGYASGVIDATKTYILGGTGVGDVKSANQVLAFTFF